ncbi:MAG: PilZ domain-containing protein [Candidatus Omnitrophota bacterium]|nr:MAG: PilZ domain-containing protein [Candidatus Omnitrophota bacterium]
MIETARKISPDTPVELSLTPPETPNPVHINARVIRSDKIEGQELFNIGIEFSKIEEDNKNTFLKFLCDTIYKLS